ncbi:hypothetical protein Tco_1063619 [Tanacetum coccineum]
MAGESGSNSVVDDLIELSGKTDPNEYLKLFVTQQIVDRRGFIARIGPEVNTVRNEVGQLNALISRLEASEDVREEYFDDAHEDYENNHSNGNVVKRGITRLYKFRMEYGKPGGVKLSVTFDALNRISGKHRALFSSFLGDMVREHIGLKILAWNKVGS